MAMSSVLITFAAAAITLQLLLNRISASPNMKYIDFICDRTNDIPFCVKTLTDFPATASPMALHPMVEAVMKLALSHAETTASFVDLNAKNDPTLATSFTECQKAYSSVVGAIKSATAKLSTSPDTANHDVRASIDYMKRVTELIGKNSDKTSASLKEMTVEMEKLLELAGGAADAVDDDDENLYRRER